MPATGMAAWTTLDRVLSLEPGRAVAVRNVPNTLSIFDSHFPRFTGLPGVLILGSLGTLAAQLLEHDAGGSWELCGAERVAFRRFVQPGDQLELTVELKERADGEARLSGQAAVDGQVVTRARVLRVRAVGG
jgi:3-hydroxyacyl-[acyl-carrier-protein] dehydratase